MVVAFRRNRLKADRGDADTAWVSRPAALAATAVLLASLVTGLTPGTPAVAVAPALAPGTMVTVAGGLGEGPARNVGQRPAGLAQHGHTLYVADSGYHGSVQVEDVVRAIDLTTGVERVVAGTGQVGFSGDGGPATAAKLYDPSALAVDAAGNLYIGDAGNRRVRKVDTAGVITTFAGGGPFGREGRGDGGPAAQAELAVGGMAFDPVGNLYVAEGAPFGRVRRIDPSGTITSFAGAAPLGADGSVGDGGPSTAAHLDYPVDVATDSAGRVYIAESQGQRVRRVDPVTGVITTVAGVGRYRTGPTQDVLATDATIGSYNITVDQDGVLWINRGDSIYKVGGDGMLRFVSGVWPDGVFPAEGVPAAGARLGYVRDIIPRPAGGIYLAETEHSYRVSVIDGSGIIRTLAGTGFPSVGGDGGPATSAQFRTPFALGFDGTGAYYIADRDARSVRRVDAGGTVSTVSGPATAESQQPPYGLTFFAVDEAGRIYYPAGDGIYRDNRDGTTTHIAGRFWGGPPEQADGRPAREAEVRASALAIDRSGRLLTSESGRVRAIDLTTGLITTVAGGGPFSFAAPPSQPVGEAYTVGAAIAAAPNGDIYIAEASQHRVRRISTDGTISIFAGTGVPGYSGDGGAASSARLNLPYGVAVDGAGAVFIADSYNQRVRKVATDGRISTVAGNRAETGEIGQVFGLALDRTGNLYLADPIHSRVRMVVAVGAPTAPAPLPPSPTPTTTTVAPTTTTTVAPTTTTTTRPLSVNQRFVDRAVRDLLGTAPPAGPRDQLAAALDAGLTRTQLAAVIVYSIEYRNRWVDGLAGEVLARQLDAGERATITGLLQHGWTADLVEALLLGSDEYLQARGSVDGFIGGAYQRALGRPATAGEVATWKPKMVTTWDRFALAAALLQSPEGRRVRVTALYQTYLRRAPDAGGLAAWVGVLQQGGREEDVIAGLVGSAAYLTRV